MAKLKNREATKELFPSLIAISDDLYNHIIGVIKKQFATRLKKITRDKIVKILNAPFFRYVFIVTREKHTIFLTVTVTDILYPSPCDCIVSTHLLFPLYGEQRKIKVLLEKIAEDVGLKNDVSCTGCDMEIKITLKGEFMPIQIFPNPFPLHNGNGQKVFATAREILSGCSQIK